VDPHRQAQRVKNDQSLVGQAVRQVRTVTKLLLTGTPLQNDLHELWSLLNLLFPELFKSSEAFDEAFQRNLAQTKEQKENGTGQAVNMDTVNQCQRLLGPLLLRRRKMDVFKGAQALPKKTVLTLYTPLSPMQKFWYKRLLLQSGAAATLMGAKSMVAGQQEDVRWKKLTGLLMQLRKACNHPFLFPGAEPEPIVTDDRIVSSCAKMQVLDRLLQRLRDKGSKALLYSQFTQVLDILEDYCKWRGIKYLRLDGGTSLARRRYEISLFQKPGSPYSLYLLSTRAGGLGITLTAADSVIIYDCDWNPTWDLQVRVVLWIHMQHTPH
jgi:SWI/SNF-related matrix-associated actin-dependent regulator of chromatin subfamily A member 5